MKADSVIKWFMPKEERFHELLSRDTENVVKASRVFASIAHSSSLEERRVKHIELKALEHDGDQLTRRVFDALNSTFITPLDREDIRWIATDLDDILDYLEQVSQNLILFELEESPEALRQFADILVAMIEEVHRMTDLVWDLGNQKAIHDSMVRISELENRGDALYATVIADLFGGHGREPVEIMKWKEVFDRLEDACDACKDFTHVIGNIVTKNA